MTTITDAPYELFSRSPDERFTSFHQLIVRCQAQKIASLDHWHLPQLLNIESNENRLTIQFGSNQPFLLNDWSFTQLCQLARVERETINRLSPQTASAVFRETIPSSNKPLQLLVVGNTVRSIHEVAYARLWNSELLAVVQEFSTDFQPPSRGALKSTGLYAGEQDLFCFFIDRTGWIEIGNESFAPGFFVWNSEVGKRSVGISPFWFQGRHANHILWSSGDIVDFPPTHSATVRDSLSYIRNTLKHLVGIRDQRRDGFVKIMQRALQTKLGNEVDEVMRELMMSGFNSRVAREALQIIQEEKDFTIFSVLQALGKIAAQLPNAGDRIKADRQAASLLEGI